MPRNPIDYSKTIIYKLCCNDINITEIYIGSTTDFKARKNHHKSNCNNEKCKIYNSKVYQFIRDNGNWDNWNMIEVERYNAIDSNDAKKKERYWIETLKSSLNSEIPSRTKKEWEEDNIEYQKKYYIENKEIFNEKAKKYYENNIEKINRKHNEYYEINKIKIQEYQKEKITCECGCIIIRTSLTSHRKTKKHQEYLKGSIPQNNTSKVIA